MSGFAGSVLQDMTAPMNLGAVYVNAALVDPRPLWAVQGPPCPEYAAVDGDWTFDAQAGEAAMWYPAFGPPTEPVPITTVVNGIPLIGGAAAAVGVGAAAAGWAGLGDADKALYRGEILAEGVFAGIVRSNTRIGTTTLSLVRYGEVEARNTGSAPIVAEQEVAIRMPVVADAEAARRHAYLFDGDFKNRYSFELFSFDRAVVVQGLAWDENEGNFVDEAYKSAPWLYSTIGIAKTSADVGGSFTLLLT